MKCAHFANVSFPCSSTRRIEPIDGRGFASRSHSRTKMRIVFLAWVLSCLVACAVSPGADSMIGVYGANDGDFNFRGELIVKPDSTYQFTWTRVSHTTNRDGNFETWSGTESGRWKIRKDGIEFLADALPNRRPGHHGVLWGQYRIDQNLLKPVPGRAGFAELIKRKKTDEPKFGPNLGEAR